MVPGTPVHSIKSISRRSVLQAGTIGLLGLSQVDVAAWRAAAAEVGVAGPKPKSVIYIFLTGGPSQHDTFDMKPAGPAEFKGEFNPIATRTPGIEICEHLPLLAQRSHQWALVRSLTHTQNGHQEGTYVMLTGRSALPPTFRQSLPQSTDWPSIAAVAGYSTTRRNELPASIVLPEKIVHSNSGTYPGQFAGLLGSQHEPWFIVVMAGEFGRTPHITHIAPEIYKKPGRDHWAPCQSILFAGGGVKGGNVIGSSDRNGAYPASDPQTPENFAATIYHALGIPSTAVWYDVTGRPNHVYQAEPIRRLLG